MGGDFPGGFSGSCDVEECMAVLNFSAFDHFCQGPFSGGRRNTKKISTILLHNFLALPKNLNSVSVGRATFILINIID